jgi:hypothetical protein
MDMTVIAHFAKGQIVQETVRDGYIYSVMSKNNICLFQSANPVKAFEYAEWFQRRRG